jgi:hypothetical protein
MCYLRGSRKLLGISSGSKTTVWIAEGAVVDTLETPRATRLLHEDEIRSVEGPDVGRGGPEGTAPG